MVERGVFHQEFRGDRVGDVEREVADFFQVVAVLIIVERAEVAEEQAVGCRVFDEFEVAGFTGLEDARGGEENLRFRGSNERDGVLVAARVFEVAVESFYAAFEGGGDLAERAAEDG